MSPLSTVVYTLRSPLVALIATVTAFLTALILSQRGRVRAQREFNLLQQQYALLEAKLRSFGPLLDFREKQLQEMREKEQLAQERLTSLSGELGSCQAHLQEAVSRADERAQWSSAQQNEWVVRFQNASEQILQSSKALFLEQNQQQLAYWRDNTRRDLAQNNQSFEGLLGPLKDALNQMQQKRQDEQMQWSEVYGALKEQLKSQAENHFAIQKDLQQLSQALRTPQGCGRWGELQLKRVVEIAGMLPYCDFEKQVTGAGEKGNLRPDMVIRLPSQRQLIIDAKAPIQSYLEAQLIQDPQKRTEKFKEHADAVRRHAQVLSQKEYWQSFKPTPEFTVLFLPGEAIFSAALEADPLLMEWTTRQNIILATPTTLIALLKAIAYGWRQHRSEENARQIAQLGTQLYHRLKKFGTRLDELRGSLARSVESYNKTASSWEGRVLVSARKLHEMSELAEGSLDIPQGLENYPKSLRSHTPTSNRPDRPDEEDAHSAKEPLP